MPDPADFYCGSQANGMVTLEADAGVFGTIGASQITSSQITTDKLIVTSGAVNMQSGDLTLEAGGIASNGTKTLLHVYPNAGGIVGFTNAAQTSWGLQVQDVVNGNPVTSTMHNTLDDGTTGQVVINAANSIPLILNGVGQQGSVIAFQTNGTSNGFLGYSPTTGLGLTSGGNTLFSVDPTGNTAVSGSINNGIFNRTIVSVSPATTNYYLIARVPASGGGTYDSLNMTAVLGGWSDNGKVQVDLFLQNRGAFQYWYTIKGATSLGWNSATYINAYKEIDATLSVYVVCMASEFAACAYSIVGNLQETVYGANASYTTTPTGTLCFSCGDPTTYPPMTSIDLYGNTTINGTLNEIGGVYMTNGSYSGHEGVSTSQICNDTGTYKALMILGNTAAGGARTVNIYDNLSVNEGITLGGYITNSTVSKWTEITTFTNSWTNFGGTWQTAAYYVDAMGWVTLRGMICSGSIGAPAFTIPSALAPGATKIFSAVNDNGSGATLNQIRIEGTVVSDPPQTTGCVTVWFGTNGYVPLEGIRWQIGG